MVDVAESPVGDPETNTNEKATKKTRKPRITAALLAVEDFEDDRGNQLLKPVETPATFTAVDQLQKHLDKTVEDPIRKIKVYRYVGTYTKRVKTKVDSAIK